MQENRAYDHYFGTLSGVRGFNDRTTVPMPTGLDAFHQPTNTSDYSQYQLPFLAEPNKTAAMCMPAPEMYYPTDIRMWNKGRMDKWNTERDGGVGMSYFDREGLPFYYTLYDNFAAGDQYFQSTFTCTCPNRQHLFSGSNGLSVGQAANEDNTEPTPGFDWPTVAELLEEKDISWKVYQQEDNFDDNGFAWHASFQSATAGDPLYDKGMFRYKDAIEEFTKDIKADTLPQVSWIIAPAIKSEHATNHPGAGEDFTARVLKGLRSNPDVYAKTAFILNYDEGGQVRKKRRDERSCEMSPTAARFTRRPANPNARASLLFPVFTPSSFVHPPHTVVGSSTITRSRLPRLSMTPRELARSPLRKRSIR